MTSARGIKRFVVTGVLAAIVLCIAPLVFRAWEIHIYYQEKGSVLELLHQLKRDRRPEKVEIETWGLAANWIITAFANVCFSESHVPFNELRRFRVDVEKRLSKDVDLATIDWISQRLAETGPHGQHYIEKWEPLYRRDLNEALTKN
ncbi:hypothetical protein LBMAG56_40360 [Verrucomicrobiota bacterium]|nr:hypothetical protein LBMAG56_40360 [Verrucomicrobiota bacterium]